MESAARDRQSATDVESLDASLVLALRAGERWAPEAIWDRYSDRVSRFFVRFGRASLHDVEDLTQDVFLRVFATHRNIKKPASLRYYVMTVATHVLTQQIRYQRLRRKVCLSVTGDVPEIATPPHADDDARHALRRCYEVLAGMRLRERAAFVLHHVEGMTMDEVAGRLKISRSTAKRLVSIATRKVSVRATRGAQSWRLS
jgi:RNA polymerase sigma-70 factor (ECF subfamily)